MQKVFHIGDGRRGKKQLFLQLNQVLSWCLMYVMRTIMCVCGTYLSARVQILLRRFVFVKYIFVNFSIFVRVAQGRNSLNAWLL